jgi:D-alanine transaminase
METCFFNGDKLPKENVRISPDDRGFLFADGIYEVVRWYGRSFYDMDNHMARLKRSLREVNIKWDEMMRFPVIAEQLITDNKLYDQNAMVYLQITRGKAKRTHNYPVPEVLPTVYATAYAFNPDYESQQKGVKIMLSEDIRWTRCDIKSISLLPNTMCFQEAFSKGYKECAFVRDGLITECSHSNIFFFREGKLFTHPESDHILSGITRKNVIRLAIDSGIHVVEIPVNERDINFIQESFLASTSAEITPVTEIGGIKVGNGFPGRITGMLLEKFQAETAALKQ